MATITEVRIWNDVGFNESDRRVPALSNLSTLPAATHIYSQKTINPAVDRLFSEMQLPLSYYQLMNASYLKVSMTFNNGTSNMAFYGWVDSVECRSDSDEYPMTIVRWHVDYWRTYAATATYTSGKVERATNLGSIFNRYKQPISLQYKTASEIVSVVDPVSSGNLYWIYLFVNYQPEGSSEVFTRTYCTPFINSSSITQPKIGPSGESTTYDTIGSDAIRSGLWTSYLKIPLASIKYACISPIPPITMNYSSAAYRPSRGTWECSNEMMSTSHNSLYMFKLNDTSGIFFEEYDLDISSYNVKSDEQSQFILTGSDGEVIHEFPYGLQVTHLKYRTVVSSTSAYIEIRGYNSSLGANYSRANGLCAVIPLQPLELSENSTSEYVYSGQRQYDINAATTQRDKSLVNGLLGIGETGMSGAITGSLTKVGGAAGAAIGLGIGALSAAGSYASSAYFDSVEQGNRDRLYASQPDTMLLSGSGFDFASYGQGIHLRKLTIDEESQDHFDNVIENDGYIVGDYVSTGLDTALRSQTGAIQISELKLGGNVPTEAKAYIKRRFANGVILS